MELFNDIYKFFRCLSFVDVIFLVAIITLLILIVTLIYFIRINKEVLDEDDLFPPVQDNKKEEVVTNIVPAKNEDLNSIIEQIPSQAVEEEYDDEEGELLDLASLTKKLQAENDDERVSCTEYEKDQEEKAIISYDELLQKRNKYAINYEKEEIMDDLIVKKVNLNDLVNKNNEEKLNEEVRVISYQKEEAFLNALKELNSLLN